jgi:hypothetical protein
MSYQFQHYGNKDSYKRLKKAIGKTLDEAYSDGYSDGENDARGKRHCEDCPYSWKSSIAIGVVDICVCDCHEED